MLPYGIGGTKWYSLKIFNLMGEYVEYYKVSHSILYTKAKQWHSLIFLDQGMVSIFRLIHITRNISPPV